jgi:hypothetical protein
MNIDDFRKKISNLNRWYDHNIKEYIGFYSGWNRTNPNELSHVYMHEHSDYFKIDLIQMEPAINILRTLVYWQIDYLGTYKFDHLNDILKTINLDTVYQFVVDNINIIKTLLFHWNNDEIIIYEFYIIYKHIIRFTLQLDTNDKIIIRYYELKHYPYLCLVDEIIMNNDEPIKYTITELSHQTYYKSETKLDLCKQSINEMKSIINNNIFNIIIKQLIPDYANENIINTLLN